MLKGTDAKLARRPTEGKAGLVTSSLAFVKWNKESAGQWKVLDLLRKQSFSQQGLGTAEGTLCRKDGGWGAGGYGYSLKILQCAPWNVQEDNLHLHMGSVNSHSPS